MNGNAPWRAPEARADSASRPPSYEPAVIVLSENGRRRAYLRWGCLALLIGVPCIYILRYLAALLYSLYKWVTEPSLSESFERCFSSVPLWVRDFIPLWILAIFAGIVVGAIIRMARRI